MSEREPKVPDIDHQASGPDARRRSILGAAAAATGVAAFFGPWKVNRAWAR